MLDTVVVMGMTVTAVEVVKNFNAYKNHKGMGKKILPFIILAVGCGLQVLNNGFFGSGWTGTAVTEAAKSGIEASVLYAGIYGMGKAAMQTPDTDVVPEQTEQPAAVQSKETLG